ncbi:glycoside hydrolase family 19 protein [Rugamonas sp. CCM 8940]|uniref:glycoside hydrolase family 19 protein n=1 Tax=Rugamonas sp. CCM 8940 TaxID=2765359 RepID=UPI0018F79A5D|nr:glycoside hydrolase family 19 protein [Rugamonas sp. CCM 8940]MBJ7310566.1 glycoside hydrolase family 19 protein [Rugamonas sp. CCM 8940]
MVLADILRTAFPVCADPAGWAEALAAPLARFDIGQQRLGHFLAQVGYESGQFNHILENLQYRSAARLVQVWPHHFANEEAARPYLGQDQLLGNVVYAGKLGNGDAASGDGYRFRGRGLIQITGRGNYAEAGHALDLDLLAKPELLEQKEHAALSAAWFWASRGLNPLADQAADEQHMENFSRISERINGSTRSVPERFQLYRRLAPLLA